MVCLANNFMKPAYIRWRDWWLWIWLPREKKQSIDEAMRLASLATPLLRSHPDIVEKIRAGESYSWPLAQKDAVDALKSVERYLDTSRTRWIDSMKDKEDRNEWNEEVCVECGEDLSVQEKQCGFEQCSYCALELTRPRA